MMDPRDAADEQAMQWAITAARWVGRCVIVVQQMRHREYLAPRLCSMMGPQAKRTAQGAVREEKAEICFQSVDADAGHALRGARVAAIMMPLVTAPGHRYWDWQARIHECNGQFPDLPALPEGVA